MKSHPLGLDTTLIFVSELVIICKINDVIVALLSFFIFNTNKPYYYQVLFVYSKSFIYSVATDRPRAFIAIFNALISLSTSWIKWIIKAIILCFENLSKCLLETRNETE